MREFWRDIPNYEGYYQISNLGRVKSLQREVINNGLLGEKNRCVIKEKILKPRTSKSKGLDTGYYRVCLRKNGCYKNFCIHKLVAQAFIPNPKNKPHVDHIDTDIRNNCVSNLKWVTQKENVANDKTRKKYEESVVKYYYKGKSALKIVSQLGLNPNSFYGKLKRGFTVQQTIEILCERKD